MPKKTQHYQLNQYEPQDSFLRTGFNEDNAKIDAALHSLEVGKCAMAFGTYTGNGASNRLIPLPFTPKAVILSRASGETYIYPNTSGGVAVEGAPLITYQHKLAALETGEQGFWVRYDDIRNSHTNKSDIVYNYAAFG